MTKNKNFNKDSAWLCAQYDLIYDCLPGSIITNIHEPKICGSQKNVIIADTPTTSYVFKFSSNSDLIRKNEGVCQALRQHNIPVPDVIMYEHNRMYAEVYPIIRGRTLYECLQDGMTHTEQMAVYKEILQHFATMSHIDFGGLNFYGFQTPVDVANEQLNNTNSGLLAKLSPMIVGLMNIAHNDNKGLYHHGITPKNTIIDTHGRLAGFIDMDEASVCSKYYAFGVLVAKAMQNGVNPDELCDMLEKNTGQKLNRTKIKNIARINNLGRNMLWQQSNQRSTK